MIRRFLEARRLRRLYPLSRRGAWAFAGNPRATRMLEIAIRNAEGGSELVGQLALMLAVTMVAHGR